jgi:protein-S-isoprenylcysteine O-methyltransferase Ste14
MPDFASLEKEERGNDQAHNQDFMRRCQGVAIRRASLVPSTRGGFIMSGLAAVLYGGVVYLLFLCTFLYAIAFVGNFPVPKTIDSGEAGALLPTLIVDILLLGLFAIQHSVMARPAFKRWWTRFVPHSVERATFVLFTNLALLLLYWQWRPIQQPVWSVTSPAGVAVMQGIFWLGFGVVLLSTFLINHFELFGLRQVYASIRGRTLSQPVFRSPFLYKRVRHPIYLGFLLAFWAAPTMTAGHLLFAIGTTGYILIGIYLEERDLIALFGDQYRRYREQVSMLIPLPRRKLDGDSVQSPPIELRRP